jgi:ABC-type Na+ transport system ATPase subunit NatA
MPLALDENIKERVGRLWFSGETRKNVAAACGIGTGSVTNIIDEQTKGLEESDIRWIRELAVQLKKDGTTLAEFVSIYRRHNYIKKLGTSEDQIESLIRN